MHNAVVSTLSLYDVIGITRHLHVKLKSFSNIAQPLHKESVHRCSFSFIIAKKPVIMSEAFLLDVSIHVLLLTGQCLLNSIFMFFTLIFGDNFFINNFSKLRSRLKLLCKISANFSKRSEVCGTNRFLCT